MSAPVVRGWGAETHGVVALSPVLPAGTVAGDLLIMFVESGGSVAASGWSAVPGFPQAATGTSLSVLWRIATGGDPTTISVPTNHAIARIVALQSGTFNPSNPFNASAVGSDNSTSGTIRSIPGATTTVAECLVFVVSTTSRDTTGGSFFSASWSNGNLANLIERQNEGTNAGDGGGWGILTGEQATAGDYGTTTVQIVTGGTSALGSFAVAPPSTAGTITAGTISAASTVRGPSLSPSGVATVSSGRIAAASTVHGASVAATGNAPLAAGRIASATTVHGASLSPSGDAPLAAGRIASATSVRGASVVGEAGAIAAGKIASATTVKGATLTPGDANVTAGRIGPSTVVRVVTVAADGDAAVAVGIIVPSTTVRGATLVGSGDVPVTAGTIGAATVVHGAALTARTHAVGRFVMTTDAYGFDLTLDSYGVDLDLAAYGFGLSVEAD